MGKSLYFIAGEASGDEHSAALMRALLESRPDLDFSGRGGPQMKRIAPDNFTDWIEAAAVVGLWEVVKRYGYFREQFAETLREITRINPDAVILIDYPGFNLRLARALRRKSRHLKIIYYISPQVWAWHRGRIGQMARYLDLMLCIFPFEADLYNQSGLRTVFVGHPMMENLAARRTLEPRQENLVALLPGSRFREVRKNFPIMLKTAAELTARTPAIHFEVAAASEALAAEIRKIVAASALREKVRVVVADASGTMQRATSGIVASGTATLEAAYFRLPFVLIYKVSWPTYFAARLLMESKFLGMPNVLAGREIVPEFIQHEARASAIAAAVAQLMNGATRERMISEFDAIIAKLGESGASAKAAPVIIDELDRKIEAV